MAAEIATLPPAALQHPLRPLQEPLLAIPLKGIPEDVQVIVIVEIAMVVAAKEASALIERILARQKPKPPQTPDAIITKSAKPKALRTTIVAVVVEIETVVMTLLRLSLPRSLRSLHFPFLRPHKLR